MSCLITRIGLDWIGFDWIGKVNHKTQGVFEGRTNDFSF